MSQGRPMATAIEPSLIPDEGWHCSHLYYRFDREILERLSVAQRDEGRQQLIACLDPAALTRPNDCRPAWSVDRKPILA